MAIQRTYNTNGDLVAYKTTKRQITKIMKNRGNNLYYKVLIKDIATRLLIALALVAVLTIALLSSTTA